MSSVHMLLENSAEFCPENADMTGLGSVLADLSLAYQGGPLADRPAERLAMIRAECKAAGHKGNDQMSGQKAVLSAVNATRNLQLLSLAF